MVTRTVRCWGEGCDRTRDYTTPEHTVARWYCEDCAAKIVPDQSKCAACQINPRAVVLRNGDLRVTVCGDCVWLYEREGYERVQK